MYILNFNIFNFTSLTTQIKNNLFQTNISRGLSVVSMIGDVSHFTMLKVFFNHFQFFCFLPHNSTTDSLLEESTYRQYCRIISSNPTPAMFTGGRLPSHQLNKLIIHKNTRWPVAGCCQLKQYCFLRYDHRKVKYS